MSENNQNGTEEIVLSVEMSDSISAQAAEAWAVGQRGGVDVAETDPTWHNNAKYYAEQCAGAEQAAQDAEDAAEQAESAKTAAEAARDRSEAIGAGAVQSATAAAESAQAAATAKTGAETAQSAAAGSATAAEGAAGRASQSATAAGQSATDAGTAKTAAEAARDAAAGSAAAAGQSAQAAAASAQAAEDVAESIPADYSQLSDDVSGLKSAIDILKDSVFNNVDDSTISKSTGGRYINFAGVQGTAAWCQLYSFKTIVGRIYLIESLAPRAVPVIYYNDTPYPIAAPTVTANDYKAAFVIVGDGNTVYINVTAADRVVVEEPIVLINDFIPYTTDLENNAEELRKIKKDIEIKSRNGYAITSEGVQGTFGGYALKSFFGERGHVYFIKTGGGNTALPLVRANDVNYGIGQTNGIFSIEGVDKTIYVNTYTNMDYAIEEYVFSGYNKPLEFLQMFDDIVCCGDSLTYGLVYTSSTTTRQANSPYPETLAKLTGCNVSKLATAGFKTSDWWNTYNEEITGANKLYIIYLGTNAALTDTVDTDCVGADYTQYAETETGYYGRIIQKIKASGSFCIIVKIAKGTTTVSNPSLINIANRFDVPIIDNPATGADSPLENMYYHYGDTTEYYNTVHMNDLGYATFAGMLLNNINQMPLEERYKIMPR